MMQKKKLIIVTTVPQTIFYILNGQPKFLSRYYDVAIVTSSGPETSWIRDKEGIEVHTLDMSRKISLASDLVSLYKLTKLFLKLRPDIVHSYTPKAGLLSMLAAFFARIKVRVHTFTGLIFPSRSGFSRALLIAMDKLTCFCATAVVSESEGVRDDLRSVTVPCNNIHIIGSGNIAGVDEIFFTPASQNFKNVKRMQLGIPLDAFVFCYVGRLNSEKGVSELVQAFQELTGNVYLILAGALDESFPINAEDMSLINLHQNILAVGQVNDVRSIYSASDINMLVSYREGFPNVLLEACSMELPSIATDVNGAREIIHNGETGWLIPVKNKDAVFNAMVSSMNEKENLDILGENCRKLVIDRYRRSDYLESLKCFYKSFDVID
ncbi:MAG: capsular biosynthesis protein [Flavobacteriales bacterium]|nr:capsular biosynthesis protein [Flavobacteriales bacterium]|tara:strand:- start:1042 stop:2184 length:1143 start_codon:yes stop_codon:yes gene_type:complete